MEVGWVIFGGGGQCGNLPFCQILFIFVDMDCLSCIINSRESRYNSILDSVSLRLYCTFPLRVQVWIHDYYNDESYDCDLNVSVT